MAVKRSTRASKKGLSESTLALLASVKAATSIQKGSSLSDRQSHCRFFNGFVIATNDVMIIGVPSVGIAMECCPHSKTLVAAIERCDGDITFSLDGQVLTVKSGRVRVPVRCLPPEALADLEPDAFQGSASPALAGALGVVASIVDETSDRIICRPVYMSEGIVEGTRNGHYAIQVWHGIAPLPTLAMPKESALAISKHHQTLTGLGINPGCATFWFSDNSFIRTRLIDIKAPDFNKVFEKKTPDNYKVIDAEFFKAIHTVLPFSKDPTGAESEELTFTDGKVWAGQAHDGNATYEYPDSPLMECAFNGKYLSDLEGIATEVDYDAFGKRLHFRGENIRGLLMGMRFDGKQGG